MWPNVSFSFLFEEEPLTSGYQVSVRETVIQNRLKCNGCVIKWLLKMNNKLPIKQLCNLVSNCLLHIISHPLLCVGFGGIFCFGGIWETFAPTQLMFGSAPGLCHASTHSVLFSSFLCWHNVKAASVLLGMVTHASLQEHPDALVGWNQLTLSATFQYV